MDLKARTMVTTADFVLERDPFDVASLKNPAQRDRIEQAIAHNAVLVFRGMPVSNEELIEFGAAFGEIYTEFRRLPEHEADQRLPRELVDISNLTGRGDVQSDEDRRLEMIYHANSVWHSDMASAVAGAGKYSILSASKVPASGGDTEFADMRAAYDALSDDMKQTVADLRVVHWNITLRSLVGFGYNAEEAAKIKPVVRPLVRSIPGSDRKSLYLSYSASHIVGWPTVQGRRFLLDLIDLATEPEFRYRHRWAAGDIVMWDNRSTMHRGRSFDFRNEIRDLRRVSTIDDDAELERLLGEYADVSNGVVVEL
jgi:alpha-ketoglutarate-dependent 2,4-dichlorophenoxyacetate dioxygenase